MESLEKVVEPFQINVKRIMIVENEISLQDNIFGFGLKSENFKFYTYEVDNFLDNQSVKVLNKMQIHLSPNSISH